MGSIAIGSSTSITPGTTPIIGGTDTCILFDKAGIVSEDTNFRWLYGTQTLLVNNIIRLAPIGSPDGGQVAATHSGSFLNQIDVNASDTLAFIRTSLDAAGSQSFFDLNKQSTFGTNDFFAQITPVSSAGFAVVEGQVSAGLVLSTTVNSILFYPGRVESARVTASAINLISANVLSWNNDTGISRDSAAVIDFGNGTQGDISATIQFTRANLPGLTTFGTTKNSIISTYRYNNFIDLGSGFGGGTIPNITFNLNGGFGSGGDFLVAASYNVFNTGDVGFAVQPPGSGGTVFEDAGAGLYLSTSNSKPVFFTPGRTIWSKVTQTGSFVLQANGALATNATDGFTYIPTCAGTPTGTPTTQTGAVPLVYDTTNNQFWIYAGGAWKQPKTPAAAAIVNWQ